MTQLLNFCTTKKLPQLLGVAFLGFFSSCANSTLFQSVVCVHCGPRSLIALLALCALCRKQDDSSADSVHSAFLQWRAVHGVDQRRDVYRAIHVHIGRHCHSERCSCWHIAEIHQRNSYSAEINQRLVCVQLYVLIFHVLLSRPGLKSVELKLRTAERVCGCVDVNVHTHHTHTCIVYLPSYLNTYAHTYMPTFFSKHR